MTPYFIPALFILVSIALLPFRKPWIDSLMLTVVALGAAVLAGLRWDADIDFMPYLGMYNDTPELRHFSQESIEGLYGEPLYLLASSIFKSAGLPFYLLTFALAIISITTKAALVCKLCSRALVAFSIYLCIHFITIEFIQIRWAVACSFLAGALYFQLKKNIALVVIFYILAIGFHYFSIICILVSVMLCIRSERLFFILCFSFSVSAIFIQPDMLVFQFASDSGAYIFQRIVRYLGDPDSHVGLYSYLKLMIYIIVPIIFKTPINVTRQKSFNYLKKLSYCLVSLSLFFTFIPVMHFRMVVLADLFGLIYTINTIALSKKTAFATVSLGGIGSAYLVWYILSLRDAVVAGFIWEYSTWLSEI